MERSFHGRTLATTAATGQAFYQATWVPIPDGFKQVPYNDLQALKKATSENTVGILVEAVQGDRRHAIFVATDRPKQKRRYLLRKEGDGEGPHFPKL